MKLTHPSSRQGIALVSVLALLTFLSIITIAFFIIVRQEREASRNYAQSTRAEELVRGALDQVVKDLRDEIRAGSIVKNVAGMEIFIPSGPAAVVPVRYGQGTEPNLVRRSWSDTAGVAQAYPATAFNSALLPPAVASPSSSATRSRNNRSVPLDRWAQPRLFLDPATPTAPDWILVTRDGPKRFGTPSASLGDPNSADFILGRYAYNIYDEGGLLDANVAGHPSGNSDLMTEASRKAASSFADLTQIPGMTPDLVKKLTDWRNAKTKNDFTTYVYEEGAESGFLKVLSDAVASDNTFLSRLDLIRFANKEMFASALPYLGTYSREVNAPSLPAGADAGLNPDFASLLYEKKPLKRFPLSRFALLEKNPASLSSQERADIQKYFGLTPDPASNSSHRKWLYMAATIGSPAAALSESTPREPNLFELLRAAIANDSMGVAVGNQGLYRQDGATSYTPESNLHQHVARLVANMADQYDGDNYPTTIQMGGEEVWGIESLPYFSEIFFKAYFPDGVDPPPATVDKGSLYVYFELWNPHTGPIPANGPSLIRIVSNGPEARVTLSYRYDPWTWEPTESGNYPFWLTKPLNLPPVQLNNLGQYQGEPRLAVNPSDSASYITIFDRPFNGYKAMTVNFTATQSKPTPTSVITNEVWLHTQNWIHTLEFQDSGGVWRPYSTMAGYNAISGTTGLQNITFVQLTANTSNNEIAKPTSTVSKPDPRTGRYRPTISQSNSFEKTMAASGYPGQDVSSSSFHKPAETPVYPALQAMNKVLSAGTLTQIGNPPGPHYVRDLPVASGKIRPGDAYLSDPAGLNANNPMRTGNTAARPIILNRPFRSIGELGYVFRDAPWKTLDLSSAESADAALLDIFCLEETPVVAGRVNANTRNPAVLQALLAGISRDELSSTTLLTAGEAQSIAADLVAKTTTTPVLHRGEIGPKLIPADPVNANYPGIKRQREAVARALAPATQTRTWNLLVDVVAQSGRYPKGEPTSLDKFVVEGERRYWIHLSLDRFTGQVVAANMELINE